jgi:hypothetical protein
MTQKIGDRTKETSTTTGTGTLSLLGAVANFQTFGNGVGSGNTTPYLIDDGVGNWELTWGTVTTGAPDTITRGALIKSSTGSRVSFSAGTKTVACVSAAELLLWIGSSDALAEATLASATTADLGSVTSLCVAISGTTTITSLGTQPNTLRYIRFTGTSLILTYNATSLITPTAANIQTAAGDTCVARSDASGNWRVISYTPSGANIEATAAGVSLTGGITLIASASIPAGHWRLTANCFTAAAAGNYVLFNLNTSGTGTSPKSQIIVTGGLAGGTGSMQYDVNLTTATTYGIYGSPGSGATTADGYLRAERII